LPVQTLVAFIVEVVSQTLFFALLLFTISPYTSSIMAVVCISISKRIMFVKIIENTSEVDNTIRYTPREETYKNRKVMFI
jgi:hypothetical protein